MLSERQISAGDVLSENALARALGMSRTPVRTAIGRLAQEGLLDILPNRGVVVTSPTLTDLEEIYAIRELLEGLAARTAAIRATTACVRELEGLIALMTTAVADGDDGRFAELDTEFHGAVAKASGNRRLKQLLDPMRLANAVAYFRPAYDRHNPRSEQSLREHRDIVTAIKNRDPEQAERAMRTHSRVAIRDALMDFFAGSDLADLEVR